MTGNFTDSSQKTSPILIRVRESIRFALAGTWSGTVVLERSESGVDGWKKIRVIQSNIDSSTRNLEDKKYYLRLRTLRFASGVANYTLEDVVGDKLWAEVLPDGTEIISVTDDGNLYVRGELFSGGGGGGTPGGAANSIQYNNAGAFGGFGSWDGSEFILPGLLALQESGGSGLVKLKCADFTSDYTITFPDAGPTIDGQTLVYDGAGTYFWEVPSVPVFTGDSGSGGTAGSVPAPATGDATKYLKGDGTWGTIASGSGDVVGPASSTLLGLPVFSDLTGKVLEELDFVGGGVHTLDLTTPVFVIKNYNNSGSGIEFGKAYWTLGSGCRTAMFLRGDSDPTTQYVEVAVDSNDISGYRRRKNFYLGDMNWDYHQSLLNDIGFRFSIATVSGVHRFDLNLRGDSHARPGQTDFVYNNNGGSDLVLYSLGTEGTMYAREIGKGLSLRQGSGTLAGNATLVAGTVTVTNANVTADSVIKINYKTAGGTQGFLTYSVSAGVSFTINSSSGSDTSVVSYEITQTHA
jgi:hypothetical protein